MPTRALEPNQVHLPGIYVDRIVQATTEKEIEILTLRKEPDADEISTTPSTGETGRKREMIARVRSSIFFIS